LMLPCVSGNVAKSFLGLIYSRIWLKKGNTEKLNQLTELFGERAKPIAEELIEAYVDGKEDVLKGCAVNVGGIAGGRKFLKNNILFKFALDDHQIYGGDEFAMKAAAQELRNVNYLVSQNSLNRLFVLPCLALITKYGLRVFATSLLPLSSNSLKYGSRNGGREIFKEDETLEKIFDVIGQTLNLKAHSVAGFDLSVKIVGPVDIEGHIGTDGKYYIVDSARLFPPESPSVGREESIYYHFLRAEYLLTSLNPLNSDVFSPFCGGEEEEKKKDEETVSKLSERLYDELIPNLASRRISED